MWWSLILLGPLCGPLPIDPQAHAPAAQPPNGPTMVHDLDAWLAEHPWYHPGKRADAAVAQSPKPPNPGDRVASPVLGIRPAQKRLSHPDAFRDARFREYERTLTPDQRTALRRGRLAAEAASRAWAMGPPPESETERRLRQLEQRLNDREREVARHFHQLRMGWVTYENYGRWLNELGRILADQPSLRPRY